MHCSLEEYKKLSLCSNSRKWRNKYLHCFAFEPTFSGMETCSSRVDISLFSNFDKQARNCHVTLSCLSALCKCLFKQEARNMNQKKLQCLHLNELPAAATLNNIWDEEPTSRWRSEGRYEA